MYAQKAGDLVSLKLKNGSVIKGVYVRKSADFYELSIGKEANINVPLHQVEAFNTEVPARRKRGYVHLQSGLFFGERHQGTQTTILLAPSIQLSGGYSLRHWLQFGLGTGFTEYGKVRVMPVFAEARGRVFDKKVSPYYSMKFGGSLADVKGDHRFQEARGGQMFELQTGINVEFSDFSWQLGTGIHQQMARLEGHVNPWGGQILPGSPTIVEHRSFRRFMVTTSFMFNF